MRSKCLCFSKKVIIFPCSGGSVLGELSDKIARRVSGETAIEMGCLAGILANTIKFPGDSRRADFVISLDGCPMACATRALRANGFIGIIALSVANMTHGQTIKAADTRIITGLTRKILRLLKPIPSGKYSRAKLKKADSTG